MIMRIINYRYLFLSIIFVSLFFASGFAQVKIVRSEFIYEKAPFPSCHASTIAETPEGLVVAFFGGTAERNPDVGIWISRCIGSRWSEPKEVANGIQPDGNRYPCWNPVLFKFRNGPLLLFYKVGPSPSQWWGILIRSNDNGVTWSKPERLPEGFMGPVKNKPVLLKNGVLLCPSSTENNGWQVQMERTADSGKTWTKTILSGGENKFSAIQPSVLILPDGKLQILCRTKEGSIAQSYSEDAGITWSALHTTSLPNPNSGIDAVTLKNGTQLLVYNPTSTSKDGTSGPRTPLSVAITKDSKNWKDVMTLESEPGEFSYPAVIQTSDEQIQITYTWKRKLIKHVTIEITNQN